MNGETWFSHAFLFREDGLFHASAFLVKDGCIAQITAEPPQGSETVDLAGAYVIPGLVDIHIHGCRGADCSDGKTDSLDVMAEYLASRGVTSFLATSMTLPPEDLQTVCQNVRSFLQRKENHKARVLGIHLEGPFFSSKKKGAQNEEFLRNPDIALFRMLQEQSGGVIRIADIAPELDGATEFTRECSSSCTISLAHSEADYDQTKMFFEAGGRHLTHMYNAMAGLHHRAPGPIIAAAERSDVSVELICDGYHVHPAMIRLAFELFPGRVCLVSDALRCTGTPDGEYTLGRQKIRLENGVARLSDGVIAGAASDLYQDMLNAVAFGIPTAKAIQAATCIPADTVGCRKVGRLEPGAYADFIVTDASLEQKAVYIGGIKRE